MSSQNFIAFRVKAKVFSVTYTAFYNLTFSILLKDIVSYYFTPHPFYFLSFGHLLQLACPCPIFLTLSIFFPVVFIIF